MKVHLQNFDSIEDYFKAHPQYKRKTVLARGGELAKIGRRCGMKSSEVAAALPRLGFEKGMTQSGLPCWRLRND